MNKYNRRSRPNLRHTCEFWKQTTEPNSAGELQQIYTLHYRGPFSMEVPRQPVEVSDAGRVQNEQTFTLIGQWCKPAYQVSAGMFCVITSLQKVYAVQGNATDPWGDRKKVNIKIIDNIAQSIARELLPTMY